MRSTRPTCSIEAVSRASGETARTPSTVLIKTGKHTPKAITAIRMLSPKPSDEEESRDDRDGRCRPRKLEQRVERSSESDERFP